MSDIPTNSAEGQSLGDALHDGFVEGMIEYRRKIDDFDALADVARDMYQSIIRCAINYEGITPDESDRFYNRLIDLGIDV